MAKLSGKRALITGGTTGIGLAAAKLFVAEGARVAISGQNAERLETAGAELGADILCVRADGGRVEESHRLVEEVHDAFGGLDVLFLNAGICQPALLADVTEALFDEHFAVNLKGALFTAQRAAPLMSTGGSIVVTGSTNGIMGIPGTVVYAATKAALRSMVRVLAGELAPCGIRVNAITTGAVDTPFYGKLDMPPGQLKQAMDSVAGKITLGRLGYAEEIAKAALFLASDDSSYTTGSELVADGGWTQVLT